MSRWLWVGICAILGLTMVICGWMVPMHLWAVEASVLQKAGRNSPGVVMQGLAHLKQQRLGGAQMLYEAAQQEGLAGQKELGAAIVKVAAENPPVRVWGLPAPRFAGRFSNEVSLAGGSSEPFTKFVVRVENRGPLLDFLGQSRRPSVQELVRFRSATNTVIFSPSESSSGQALDAGLSICGLLIQDGSVSTELEEAITTLASDANRGANSQRLEQAMMDFLSLAQRLNYGQLSMFVAKVEEVETLRVLAQLVRKSEGQLPVMFSAVHLSGKPAEVARYLLKYSRTGLKDLGTSLQYGAGATGELLKRGQRVYRSDFRDRLTAGAPFRGFVDSMAEAGCSRPQLALGTKWLLLLAGGFFLCLALHFARRPVTQLEKPLQVRGIHLAREGLFALGFLLVVLLLSEPFLAQESQRTEFPFRLRLSTVGSTAPAATKQSLTTIMNQSNQLSLMTLLLFFVLQGLLYTASLVKLAEIRRQRVPARTQLKLLENEDHLFDAGLYLGFAGTIVSLILVSMGVVKFSLMAAYSSTSFGIIFVSIFKICNLRPTRRKLLLEADMAAGQPTQPGSRATMVQPT